jgi:hypothetical protein
MQGGPSYAREVTDDGWWLELGAHRAAVRDGTLGGARGRAGGRARAGRELFSMYVLVAQRVRMCAPVCGYTSAWRGEGLVWLYVRFEEPCRL